MDDEPLPDSSESKSCVLKMQAILEIVISLSLLKRESFKIWSKVKYIQTNVESIAQICLEMRRRIVTLVEQNWSLQAELTETVPRSKYQSLNALYDEVENKAKVTAEPKQIGTLMLLDLLSLRQADKDQLSAGTQVRLF
jgi:hypothetical protein